MLNLVKEILNFYIKNQKIPTKNDINIKNMSLLEKKGNIFITLYKNGDIVGNAGNVVELEENLVNELIKNTLYALGDKRFPEVTVNDLENIKIRIDNVINRTLLSKNGKTILDINPKTSGVLVIKKDYSKLCVILPNISNNVKNGSDLNIVLSNKLDEEFVSSNYLVYEIVTEIFTDL